jgi:REP element-mobilizing transposase RayT
MKTRYPIHWPHFYTATIQGWKQLLSTDGYKEIIIDSLKTLVTEKRIELNAFVIMHNHIHLIWQALPDHSPESIQAAFMKFTAHQMKQKLSIEDTPLLEEFKVNKYDRTYQFWKRDSLSIELFTEKVFAQKLEYIHYNPVLAGYCTYPEEYKYSSAKFYELGIDDFGILTHFSGN